MPNSLPSCIEECEKGHTKNGLSEAMKHLAELLMGRMIGVVLGRLGLRVY